MRLSPSHRWLGLGRDLHEVHTRLPCHLQRFEGLHNALLVPVRVNQTHLADPNALIYPEILLGEYTSFSLPGSNVLPRTAAARGAARLGAEVAAAPPG